MKTVSPTESRDRQQAGALLIDVRTAMEFAAIHASGAVHLELDAIQNGATPTVADPSQEVLVICKSGGRSARAASLLAETIPNPVFSVDGGTDRWVSEALPHEKAEKQPISLERQVRIAAGLIVLVGAILAASVSSAFIVLPAFVGAGLVFAGVTDWCGMALLLSKASWNRVKAD